MSESYDSCHICGVLLGEETVTCNVCDRQFHLRNREDSDGQDCGEVWINEQFLALEFACNTCLGKVAGVEPPVARGH